MNFKKPIYLDLDFNQKLNLVTMPTTVADENFILNTPHENSLHTSYFTKENESFSLTDFQIKNKNSNDKTNKTDFSINYNQKKNNKTDYTIKTTCNNESFYQEKNVPTDISYIQNDNNPLTLFSKVSSESLIEFHPEIENTKRDNINLSYESLKKVNFLKFENDEIYSYSDNIAEKFNDTDQILLKIKNNDCEKYFLETQNNLQNENKILELEKQINELTQQNKEKDINITNLNNENKKLNEKVCKYEKIIEENNNENTLKKQKDFEYIHLLENQIIYFKQKCIDINKEMQNIQEELKETKKKEKDNNSKITEFESILKTLLLEKFKNENLEKNKILTTSKGNSNRSFSTKGVPFDYENKKKSKENRKPLTKNMNISFNIC